MLLIKAALSGRYYAKLVEEGPSGLNEQYSWDDLWQDYRWFVWAFTTTIVAAYLPDLLPMMGTTAKESGDNEFLEGMRALDARLSWNYDARDIYSVTAELLAHKKKFSSQP